MAISISPTTSAGIGTLTAPGVGSGLDVNSIVTQLMNIESQPLTLLDQQQASYLAKISSLGKVQGALSAFQSAALALSNAGAATNRADSSNTAALAATATGSAAAGIYSIDITRLAQAQKLVAAGQASTTDAIGGGAATTVTLSFGSITGGSFDSGTGAYTGAAFTPNAAVTPVAITIDNSNNTLAGIRDAINAANAGVTASIVNDGSGTPYRLALSVAATGAANSLKVDVSGEAAIANLLSHDPSGTQHLSQTRAAQNAALTIDGIAVTSPTNSVSGAIDGVTLTLGNVPASPVTLTVQRDTSAATSAASNFVKVFNTLNQAIATETGKAAQLQGDPSVFGIQERLRSAIGGLLPAGSAFYSLSDLGFSFQLDGSLTFNSSKLAAAFDSNPAGTLSTLASAGSTIKSLVDGYLSTDGTIAAETAGFNRSIDEINSRRAQLQLRLTGIEQRYRAQFSTLDALLGSMNQTSQFLTQQLALLPGATGTK